MSAIKRVPKKKRSQSARAIRPAPWNVQPEPAARGLRYLNATLRESDDLPLGRRPSLEPSLVASRWPLGDRGLRTTGYGAATTSQNRRTGARTFRELERPLTKHNPFLNVSLESADYPGSPGASGKRTTKPRGDTTQIPWQDPETSPHLDTETGRPRGQRHPDMSINASSVQLEHDGTVKQKVRRSPGRPLSHDARLVTCFDQGTYLRGRSEVPAAERLLRAPYGTAYNYTNYEPIRRYTVHYDTRDLLTYI